MFGITTLLMSVLAIWAPTGRATVTAASTEFSNGTLSEFSQVNELNGSISVESSFGYSGNTAALATYNGSGQNGYARAIWNVNWEDGDDVWFGAAYYLPPGFLANVQGQVDLVRWDNWSLYPNEADWGGVSIYGSDHRARLLRFGANRPNDTLVGPFDLPEGQWFTLEVHQIRSQIPGQALSQVYLNGNLLGSSSAANTYGRPATRIRFGIVAVAEGAQTKPLSLYFDNPDVRPEEEPVRAGGGPETPTSEGPVAGSPAPEDPPATGPGSESPPATEPAPEGTPVEQPTPTPTPPGQTGSTNPHNGGRDSGGGPSKTGGTAPSSTKGGGSRSTASDKSGAGHVQCVKPKARTVARHKYSRAPHRAVKVRLRRRSTSLHALCQIA